MKHAVILFVIALAIIAAWGVGFAIVAHVSLLTGMYWAVTTATTVGYGDVTAHASGGMILAIGCMLTSIPALGVCFSMLTSWHVRRHVHRRMDAQDRRHDLALAGIRNILLKLEARDE